MTRDPRKRPDLQTEQEIPKGAREAESTTRQGSMSGETKEAEEILLLRTAIAAGDASGVAIGNPFDRIRATFALNRRIGPA
jgi:hypothetical protein